MLQFNPELFWSIWNWVGVILSVPVMAYWFNLRKVNSRKIWEIKELKSDSDALRLVRRYLEFIAIPFIGGGLIDLIANVVTYPNMIQQVMYRGFIYYIILLCVLGLNYFCFYWAIKETTNPWDKLEKDTSLN